MYIYTHNVHLCTYLCKIMMDLGSASLPQISFKLESLIRSNLRLPLV